jgi:hypothetical protein
VFIGGRWVPRDISRVALEEIRHEDAVFLFVRGGQDIGTLDGLIEETKDI